MSKRQIFSSGIEGTKLVGGREFDKRDIFMQVAQRIAMLGTCDRKYVGAVIIRDGRCVSWGYNGAPPGLPHCNDNFHGWSGVFPGPESLARDLSHRALEKEGCRNATHAEANALAFAARQGISTDASELFVTLSPCESCSRLIIAAGIVRVHYREVYRDRSGLDLLKGAGIGVIAH